jgi:hypothetical protein
MGTVSRDGEDTELVTCERAHELWLSFKKGPLVTFLGYAHVPLVAGQCGG